MPRREQFQFNYYNHAYNRGFNHNKIFHDHKDYEYFMSRVEYAIKLFRIVDIYAITLLPNHFHLIAKVWARHKDATAFSRFMGYVQQSYATYYAKRYTKKWVKHGQLFEWRFQSKPLYWKTYTETCFNYVLHNAKKHWLVSHAKDWNYSSFHDRYCKLLTPVPDDIQIHDDYQFPNDWISYYDADDTFMLSEK